MKRWITLGIIMLLLSSLTIFAQGIRGTAHNKTENLMAGIDSSIKGQQVTAASEAAVAAFDRFALELVQKSLTKKQNLLISPLSVYLALSMTLNGARGQTANEMVAVLGNQETDTAGINTASRFWMDTITSENKKTTISIANSIWFDQRYTPSDVFLQTNADYYSAAVRKLDFAHSSALTLVNRWVEDATRGTIDKIVDNLDPDSPMVLINAVYFLSDWAMTFDPQKTYDRTFHSSTQEIITPFMSQTDQMVFLKGQDAVGVALPYVDKRYVFFALMPDNSADVQQWLESRKSGTFLSDIRNLVNQPATTLVALSIPKFEATYEDSLVNELDSMGMIDAFIASKADFSAMNAAGTKDLFIGDVIHKTFIRTDEKGTEAAAVTAVIMKTTAMAFKGVTLVFDKPFFYGIMDLKTGLPLFLGVFLVPDTKLT
jgi:serine protease inhibitor